MAKIVSIEKDSIGEELGIEVGDELIGFDGQEMVDILDYFYYDAQEFFVMNMRAKQGDLVDIEVEKFDTERLGFSFDESMELSPMACKNKCVFCFIDQLPKGMRKSLYVKDDDYRLSFVSGNYVTLTNVGQKELERIAKLHLSPLYISVHCYNKEVKTKMIANPEGAKLFEKMEYLASCGINMHAQIVLCKGLNDGDVLKETLLELYKLKPNLLTVAVIPLGMTDYREGLANLEPIDKQCASDVVEYCEWFDNHVGGNFVYCADEFYLKAEKELPSYESYGDFGQIEDGVGLVADFEHQFANELSLSKGSTNTFSVGLITGQAFKNRLSNMMRSSLDKFPNIDYTIYDIVNNFFGNQITVAGLITAKDVLEQVKNCPKNLIIPSTMLKEFSTTLLDGVTVEELESALNTRIHISSKGKDIIKIIEEVANE